MAKRIVFISDTQMPYDDRRVLSAVIGFIGDYEPDEVIHIGDLADFPQPSRWSKDSAAEYQGSVFEDAEQIKRRFFEPLRAVYSGKVGVIEGNHDERPRTYLAKYAPALAASRAFHMDSMLDFDGFGVDWLDDFYEFGPGWVATHGHRGGIRLTQDAGKTALNAAVRFEKSVVMGHTHRLGSAGKSFGYAGSMSTRWGVELGNLMDMRQAGYLKGATANWQQGFGIGFVDNDYVVVHTVPILNGTFLVEGEVYTV